MEETRKRPFGQDPLVLDWLSDYEISDGTVSLMRGVITATYDPDSNKLEIINFLRGGNASFHDVNRARDIASEYEASLRSTSRPRGTQTSKHSNSVFTRIGQEWLAAVAPKVRENATGYAPTLPETPIGETGYCFNPDSDEHEFTVEEVFKVPISRVESEYKSEAGLQLGNENEFSNDAMIVYHRDTQELKSFFENVRNLGGLRKLAKSLNRTLSGLGMDWVKAVALQTGVNTTFRVNDQWKIELDDGSEVTSWSLMKAAKHILADDFEKCPNDSDDDSDDSDDEPDDFDDDDDDIDLEVVVDLLKRKMKRSVPAHLNAEETEAFKRRYLQDVACTGYYGQWGFTGHGEFTHVNVSKMKHINAGFADLCV